MREFLISFLLSSLGTSLAVILLSLLFSGLKSRLSPKVRYLLWLLLLASFLLPFRPRLGQGLIRLQTDLEPAASALPAAAESGVSQAVASQPSFWDQILPLPWFEILLLVWFLGFLYMVGKYAYSYLRFQKMLGRWGQPVEDGDILKQLEEAKATEGVSRSIRLLHYPLVQSPMLLGFRQVTILLPELDYTAEELQLIFQHELTHYRHRDVLVNLFTILVQSLHWFNPLVRFACKETLEAGEMYVDYDLLHSQDSDYRTFYGETILTMIDRSKKTPLALSSCFYSNKFNLKRRIMGIMDQGLPKRFLSVFAALALASLLLLTSSVFALDKTSAARPAPMQTSQQGQNSSGISQEQAVSAALGEHGLAAKDVTALTVRREKAQYHISFSRGQTSYESLVDALTGSVIRSKQRETVEKTVTVEKPAPSPAPSSSSQPAAGETSLPSQSSQRPESSQVPAPSSPNRPSSAESDEDDDDDDDD